MAITVSILVRSCNDARYIADTLTSLLAQQCEPQLEIVCCDDASHDGTEKIIARFPGVRLIDRPTGEYLPGRTLNHMVRQCNGDIVVFNNADAVPQSNDYIKRLIAPLLDERQAAAAYANQLPRSDAEYLVRKDHLRAFGDGKIAEKWSFFFSLAAAAMHRKELLDAPFNESMRYSEDVEWAWRRQGKIVYVQEAQVEHSHNYTFAELRRRFYGEGYADAQIFGSAPDWWTTLRRVAAESLRDFAYLLPRPKGWREMLAAPRRRWLQKYYFMKGARDFLRGKAI